MSPPAARPIQRLPETPGPQKAKVVDVRDYDGALARRVPFAIAEVLVRVGLADPVGYAGHVRLKLGIRRVPPSSLKGLLLAVRQFPKQFEGTNHRRITMGPEKVKRDTLLRGNGPFVNHGGTLEPNPAGHSPRLGRWQWRRLSVRQAAAILNVDIERVMELLLCGAFHVYERKIFGRLRWMVYQDFVFAEVAALLNAQPIAM